MNLFTEPHADALLQSRSGYPLRAIVTLRYDYDRNGDRAGRCARI